jgi:hypothetical protein
MTVALPVVVDWLRRLPPRSAQRLTVWACVVSLSVVTIDAILALNNVPRQWLFAVLAAGQLVAAVPLGIGWARLRAARRRRDESLLRPDRLAPGRPELWIRPRKDDDPPPRRLGDRVDRWLAADGPAPTVGWWHNGGLILDDQGPALVDAAGLRHGLPAGATTLVQLTAPKSVLLMDVHEQLLARLPTTGFDDDDLRRFAVAAGWRYDRTVRPLRTARQAVDLRAAVVDRAAKDRRLAARGRKPER